MKGQGTRFQKRQIRELINSYEMSKYHADKAIGNEVAFHTEMARVLGGVCVCSTPAHHDTFPTEPTWLAEPPAKSDRPYQEQDW